MSKFTTENYKSFFAYRNFSELNPKERKDLIKFTVEKIREDKGLAAVKFRCKDMERENRGYCSQEKSLFGEFKNHNLVLNSDILYSKRANISYETFNTINHELEHAMQYENNANVELSNDIPEILEQRLNDEHYYAADGDKIVGLFNDERTARFDIQTDYQLYRAQACESDAREAGLQAVEKLRIDNERNGVIDDQIINYLDAQHADDIVDSREMLTSELISAAVLYSISVIEVSQLSSPLNPVATKLNAGFSSPYVFSQSLMAIDKSALRISNAYGMEKEFDQSLCLTSMVALPE